MSLYLCVVWILTDKSGRGDMQRKNLRGSKIRHLYAKEERHYVERTIKGLESYA
jgi:hypothetical protein